MVVVRRSATNTKQDLLVSLSVCSELSFEYVVLSAAKSFEASPNSIEGEHMALAIALVSYDQLSRRAVKPRSKQ